MDKTEDIIYGDRPHKKRTHYVEQNLVVFTAEELNKLFQLLKKYYQDSCDDLEYAEARFNEQIRLVNKRIDDLINELAGI